MFQWPLIDSKVNTKILPLQVCPGSYKNIYLFVPRESPMEIACILIIFSIKILDSTYSKFKEINYLRMFIFKVCNCDDQFMEQSMQLDGYSSN